MHNTRRGRVTLLSRRHLTPVWRVEVCTFLTFPHQNPDLFTTVADRSCLLIAKLLVLRPLTPVRGEYVVYLKHRRASNEDICFHMVLDT